LDPARVGVLGHSFGGVTTGLVLQDDPRPIAGVSIAAPVENPLLAGVSIADIHDPLLLIVAKEDHSIGAIGNDLMRQNFENGNPPMYEVSVEDAGHWSFSDICALTPSFSAGCGQAQRQEDSSQTFEYLPVAQARSIASAYVTAFFSGVILGEAAGLEYVRGAHPSALVEARARE
jgi:predicted dienelactone hydrolase